MWVWKVVPRAALFKIWYSSWKGYRLNKSILNKRLAVVQILHQVNEYKKQKVQPNPEKWCHLGQSNQYGQCSIFDPNIIHLKDHSPFCFWRVNFQLKGQGSAAREYGLFAIGFFLLVFFLKLFSRYNYNLTHF